MMMVLQQLLNKPKDWPRRPRQMPSMKKFGMLMTIVVVYTTFLMFLQFQGTTTRIYTVMAAVSAKGREGRGGGTTTIQYHDNKTNTTAITTTTITTKNDDNKNGTNNNNEEDAIVNVNVDEEDDDAILWNSPQIFDQLMEYGPNLLSTISGCRIARWLLPNQLERDCKHHTVVITTTKLNITMTKNLISPQLQLQMNDTIYITFLQLEDFVSTILPNVTVNVVILIGSTAYPFTSSYYNFLNQILNNQYVLHVFCMNIPSEYYYNFHNNYGYNNLTSHHHDQEGDTTSSTTHHHLRLHTTTKLSSFPYGLKEIGNKPTLRHYKDVLRKLHYNNTNTRPVPITTTNNNNNKNENNANDIYNDWFLNKKTNILFHGSPRKLPGTRTTILAQLDISKQQQIIIPPQDFFVEMSKSKYVLSPNGDRPECYRHYEAIGLGTIPITELDSNIYSHFENSIIYNHTHWNITQLVTNELERRSRRRNIQINRNLIFEEYWIAYCNRIVGQSLNWWNPSPWKPY